jgi:Type IV secretion system pilin
MKSMRNIWKRAGWAFFTAVSLLAASPAFASGQPISLLDPLGCAKGSSGGSCFTQIAGNVIQFLITIGAALMAILVIIGGIQMMTAAGDPEKFGKGKKTLLYAVVGFVVLLISQGIASLLKNILTGS